MQTGESTEERLAQCEGLRTTDRTGDQSHMWLVRGFRPDRRRDLYDRGRGQAGLHTFGLWKASVWIEREIDRAHTRGRCEERMRQVVPLRRGRLAHFEPSCGKLLADCLAYVCPATREVMAPCARVCTTVRAGGSDPHSKFNKEVGKAEYHCTKKGFFLLFILVTLCLYLRLCARPQ